MTWINSAEDGAVLVREADQEILRSGPNAIRLLADAEHTDGAISAHRVTLGDGSDGARPHFHTRSAEIFFVLDGALSALAGDTVHTLERGDFLVVPKGMTHAFAAPPGSSADTLILFTPGLFERFEYFRLGARVARGQAAPEEILASQERFDNHFLESAVWQALRGPR